MFSTEQQVGETIRIHQGLTGSRSGKSRRLAAGAPAPKARAKDPTPAIRRHAATGGGGQSSPLADRRRATSLDATIHRVCARERGGHRASRMCDRVAVMYAGTQSSTPTCVYTSRPRRLATRAGHPPGNTQVMSGGAPGRRTRRDHPARGGSVANDPPAGDVHDGSPARRQSGRRWWRKNRATWWSRPLAGLPAAARLRRDCDGAGRKPWRSGTTGIAFIWPEVRADSGLRVPALRRQSRHHLGVGRRDLSPDRSPARFERNNARLRLSGSIWPRRNEILDEVRAAAFLGKRLTVALPSTCVTSFGRIGSIRLPYVWLRRGSAPRGAATCRVPKAPPSSTTSGYFAWDVSAYDSVGTEHRTGWPRQHRRGPDFNGLATPAEGVLDGMRRRSPAPSCSLRHGRRRRARSVFLTTGRRRHAGLARRRPAAGRLNQDWDKHRAVSAPTTSEAPPQTDEQ